MPYKSENWRAFRKHRYQIFVFRYKSCEITSNLKERTDRKHKKHRKKKTWFPNEQVENADLCKPVPNKIMNTRE